MSIGRLFLGVSFSLIFAQASLQADLLPFQWRAPLPQGYNLNSVAYGNGLFVAVGDFGTALTSPDGTNWQTQNTGLAGQLSTLSFGNGLFVAAGANGTIITSPNGITWTRRTSGDANDFLSSAYGNGLFVLGNSVGDVAVSSDGVAWTVSTKAIPYGASQLAFGNGFFLALDGNGGVDVSGNGSLWSAVTNSITGDHVQTASIAFGNDKFYRSGQLYPNWPGSTSFLATSEDGTNWSFVTDDGTLSKLAANDNLVLGLASYESDSGGPPVGAIYTLETATHWGQTLPPTTRLPLAISFGANRWVAVGQADEIAVSTDGTNWTTVGGDMLPFEVYNTIAPSGLASAAGATVAAAGDLATTDFYPTLTNGFFVATNGSEAFDTFVSAPNPVYDVTAQNGEFLAVGAAGSIEVSSNGLSWSSRSAVTAADLHCIRRVSAGYVSVGDSGALITSTTGNAWTLRASGTSQNLFGLAENNAITVAIGADGNIVSSSDLVNWNAQYSGVLQNLNAAAAGTGGFVAVGDSGVIVTSPDGANWAAQTSGVTNDLASVIFNNGMFLAGGSEGVLLTSSDGITWQQYAIATPSTLYAITPDNTGYLILGDLLSINLPLAKSDYFIFHIGTLRPSGLSAATFASGGFSFNFSGNAGAGYTLETSTDLVNWTPMYSFTTSAGSTNLIDPSAAKAGNRYYRVTPQ